MQTLRNSKLPYSSQKAETNDALDDVAIRCGVINASWIYLGLLLLTLGLLTACANKEETGPAEVRWDREACERCAMSVSDRKYSAQVRGGPSDRKTRVYKFDDIGCAVIWLDKQEWKNDQRTEIWVTDNLSGNWIDARQASYVTGQITPMGYGLGARSEPTEGSLDFAAANKHIYEIEQTTHKQRGGMHHMHHQDGQ